MTTTRRSRRRRAAPEGASPSSQRSPWGRGEAWRLTFAHHRGVGSIRHADELSTRSQPRRRRAAQLRLAGRPRRTARDRAGVAAAAAYSTRRRFRATAKRPGRRSDRTTEAVRMEPRLVEDGTHDLRPAGGATIRRFMHKRTGARGPEAFSESAFRPSRASRGHTHRQRQRHRACGAARTRHAGSTAPAPMSVHLGTWYGEGKGLRPGPATAGAVLRPRALAARRGAVNRSPARPVGIASRARDVPANSIRHPFVPFILNLRWSLVRFVRVPLGLTGERIAHGERDGNPFTTYAQTPHATSWMAVPTNDHAGIASAPRHPGRRRRSERSVEATVKGIRAWRRAPTRTRGDHRGRPSLRWRRSSRTPTGCDITSRQWSRHDAAVLTSARPLSPRAGQYCGSPGGRVAQGHAEKLRGRVQWSSRDGPELGARSRRQSAVVRRVDEQALRGRRGSRRRAGGRCSSGISTRWNKLDVLRRVATAEVASTGPARAVYRGPCAHGPPGEPQYVAGPEGEAVGRG